MAIPGLSALKVAGGALQLPLAFPGVPQNALIANIQFPIPSLFGPSAQSKNTTQFLQARGVSAGTTTNTGFQNLGFGGSASITPASTGNILALITGTEAINPNGGNTIGTFTAVQGVWGTGSAPALGANSGTVFTSSPDFGVILEVPPAQTTSVENTAPFALSNIITGLNIGTPIWVDLQLRSGSLSGGYVSEVTILLQEY